MSEDRRPYSAAEKETFGFVDDEEQSERPLEEEMLGAEDYRGADRYGTTPAEERRGVPLDEYIEDEEPDEPSEEVTDDWPEAPDPRAGTLVDNFDVFAEEVSPEPAVDQSAIHITEDDRDRAETIRESWEGDRPLDPDDDMALDEDREAEPEPDDWR